MITSAVISDDGLYRYRLERCWEADAGTATWIMLNPSTADATVDDQTLTRCLSFTRRAGWGRLLVVNLYALRSTDPAALEQAADPVGPRNVDHVRAAMEEANVVVAAWGSHAMALRSVLRLRLVDMAPDGADVVCLGLAGKRHPRHPCRVGNSTAFEKFKLP